MRRTQIYLDEEQARRLAERAAATGATKSMLIRQAVDAWLDAEPPAAARLARFKAAARRVAGCAPYLPDGASYVAELREHDARRDAELDSRRRA